MMKTTQVWELYAEDIKQFILSKVHDEVMADDLLQESFIKIHTKLQTLKDEDKLKAWVFSVARHTTMDYFRNSGTTAPFEDKDLAVEDSFSEHSHEDCLQGIIKSLPAKYRKPLILADIKGLKQAAISQLLDVPLPTVKSQIQRARKLIAQGFVDCCDFKINDKGLLVGELQEKENCKICN